MSGDKDNSFCLCLTFTFSQRYLNILVQRSPSGRSLQKSACGLTIFSINSFFSKSLDIIFEHYKCSQEKPSQSDWSTLPQNEIYIFFSKFWMYDCFVRGGQPEALGPDPARRPFPCIRPADSSTKGWSLQGPLTPQKCMYILARQVFQTTESLPTQKGLLPTRSIAGVAFQVL